MTALGPGSDHALRSVSHPQYLQSGDPGRGGGGTYNTISSNGAGDSTEQMLQQYENIFGPAARDIKFDSQRDKRRQRWHLPDVLKGPNDFLTTRVDGLITDATKSPFTGFILPYKEKTDPDAKFKWNVYLFDEGLASRVPYESAARVLPQSKRSFAGYTVRQGLAIAMEHNFLASPAGRENFRNQLQQLVGSVQLTNDLDVHVALLHAPSYQKQIDEKYYDQHKTVTKTAREYVDLFGIMQKIPHALDFLIEDAKNHLQTWGSKPPNFLLTNGALTTQLTMLPEVTNYVTNGDAGPARLAAGPDLASYRGLKIINSRKFSMESGTAPRDLLRRRVRVAEYYRIPWTKDNHRRSYEFYDQSRDTMFRLTWDQLMQMSTMDSSSDSSQSFDDQDGSSENEFWHRELVDSHFDLGSNGNVTQPHSLFTVVVSKPTSDGGWKQMKRYQKYEDDSDHDVQKMASQLVSDYVPLIGAVSSSNVTMDSDKQHNSAQELRLEPPYDYLYLRGETWGSGIFTDRISVYKPFRSSIQPFLNYNLLHPASYNSNDSDKRDQYYGSENLFETILRIPDVKQYIDAIQEVQLNAVSDLAQNLMEQYGSASGVLDLQALRHSELSRWLFDIGDAVNFKTDPSVVSNVGESLAFVANQKNDVPEKSDCQPYQALAILATKIYIMSYMEFVLGGSHLKWTDAVSDANQRLAFVQGHFQVKSMQIAKLTQGAMREDHTNHMKFVTDQLAKISFNPPPESCFRTMTEINPHVPSICNLALQPNMYLSHTKPATWDLQTQRIHATSLNQNVWVLQSMLSQMALSKTACQHLLQTVTIEDESFIEASMQYLLVNKQNSSKSFVEMAKETKTEWIWQSNLMLLFMSLLHPTADIRNKATNYLQMNQQLQNQFLQSIRQAMSNNNREQSDFNREITKLFNEGMVHPDCRVCTDVSMQGVLFATQRQASTVLNAEQVPSEHSSNIMLNRGGFKSDILRFSVMSGEDVNGEWYDASTVQSLIPAAMQWAEQNQNEVLKHFVLVMMKRFFKPSFKFMFDGEGMPVPAEYDSLFGDDTNTTKYVRLGESLLHGPDVPKSISSSSISSSSQKDLLVLRPNIEHNMLGVIMGRGGDGELGHTFWGQTELSCYDDSQHGIWGMSYK